MATAFKHFLPVPWARGWRFPQRHRITGSVPQMAYRRYTLVLSGAVCAYWNATRSPPSALPHSHGGVGGLNNGTRGVNIVLS